MAMKEELIKNAYSEAITAHGSPGKPFLKKSSTGSSEVIFSFPGSWAVKDWHSDMCQRPFGEKKINLKLFPSLRSIGKEEAADVNQAFEERFQLILENPKLKDKVQKAAKDKKQVVFTGHSSGGAIAILATIWFLEEHRKGNIIFSTPPLCLTFGSPLVGSHIFSHALRRENWSGNFIHFVWKYDIVPRVFLAPLSANKQQFGKILNFLSQRSQQVPLHLAQDAQDIFTEVMTNALTLTSHVACKLMESTNLLLETVTSFIELSPYRPFGTYVFLNVGENPVTLDNSNAVLQLLFYSCQPSSDDEVLEIAKRSLGDHHGYESELPNGFRGHNYSPDKANADEIDMLNKAADAFGLSTSGRLCLLAAGESEEQKKRNQEKVKSKVTDMERALKEIEHYKNVCELEKVGLYDSFKLQKDQKDFKANVKRLELTGIWDEIIELLKWYKLPDEFEGQRQWIDLGTQYRRLVEPLDIANYYRHLKNEDTGPYMTKGRPKRYRYQQQWREHEKKMEKGSSGESCFWADVEELCCNGNEEDVAKKIQKQVLQWEKEGEMGNDVFLHKSTFVKWWNSLDSEIKLNDIQPLIHG
ncbi:Alpha/beta-hydrolase [Trema orientale]|uniref:Alpha/beta-hydrolase n=1 Tax=Trema orientale TaxID=63057 RepID=A0A2P5EKK2_TREOI|nr:Alpha/beta-hydrolase [Trema orientale]